MTQPVTATVGRSDGGYDPAMTMLFDAGVLADREAERRVLGEILANPGLWNRVHGILYRPEMFSDGRHRWIYRAMVEANGQPAEMRAALEREVRWPGIWDYVDRLRDGAANLNNLDDDMARVMDLYLRCRLVEAAKNAMGRAWHEGTPLQEALLGLRDELKWVKTARLTPEAQGSTWADLDALIGPIRWAWDGWLPRGMVTMLAGEQGVGKSLVALRLAATLARGEAWPDGQRYQGETGDVLWCEAEAAQALNRERGRAWGLPLERFRSPLRDPVEDVRLDNAKHRAALAEAMRDPQIVGVVLDSLRGLHSGDENHSEAGMTVKWLAELARDTGQPVLLTHHLRKRGLLDEDNNRVSLDRLRGSSAITQTARVVWVVDAPDAEHPERKRLSTIKNNIARFPEPVGFTIEEDGLEFCPAPEAPRRDLGQMERAMALLRETLARGAVRVSEVEARAKEAGISGPTLRRAKDRLGVKVAREKEGWTWTMPGEAPPEFEI